MTFCFDGLRWLVFCNSVKTKHWKLSALRRVTLRPAAEHWEVCMWYLVIWKVTYPDRLTDIRVGILSTLGGSNVPSKADARPLPLSPKVTARYQSSIWAAITRVMLKDYLLRSKDSNNIQHWLLFLNLFSSYWGQDLGSDVAGFFLYSCSKFDQRLVSVFHWNVPLLSLAHWLKTQAADIFLEKRQSTP